MALPTPNPDRITLAVLAGGAGTRMGRPKAWLELGGQPILLHLLDRLAWPGPTLLVTAPGFEHPPGRHRFTAEAVDPVPGQGPLRGLLTALEHCGTETLLVTPVDMPLVGSPQLRWLASALHQRPELAAVLSVRRDATGEQIEPFPCALRRDRAKPAVAGHLAGGRRSVLSLLSRADFAAVPAPADWEGKVWTNLNHPSDLAELSDPSRGDEKGAGRFLRKT